MQGNSTGIHQFVKYEVSVTNGVVAFDTSKKKTKNNMVPKLRIYVTVIQ